MRNIYGKNAAFSGLTVHFFTANVYAGRIILRVAAWSKASISVNPHVWEGLLQQVLGIKDGHGIHPGSPNMAGGTPGGIFAAPSP
ncbi:MAG: hypothetical protein M5U34_12330 [Chloroflexi bacterium]|nr:hypothetical protein [Chloroflexota bacterium]